jgi:endonuclease YncB( thermonuclease family)
VFQAQHPGGVKDFFPFLLKQVTIILMDQRQNRRLVTIISLLLALVLVSGSLWYWQGLGEDSLSQENQTNTTTINGDQKPDSLPLLIVTRVIDGDTIEADQERIRLIGLDAEEIPLEGEASCRALVAKEYLSSLLLNQEIEIEVGQEPKDQYGRTLAYVFFDQKLINAKIIEEGLADVWLIAPNTKYHQQLIEAQVVGQEKQENIDFCQQLN